MSDPDKPTLFQASDGVCDVFVLHGFGYHLPLVGAEGRKAMIERLVSSGIVNWYSGSGIPYGYFSDEYRRRSQNYVSRVIGKLTKAFPREKGMHLADRIFYEYSVRGNCWSLYNGRPVKIYCPLLERELVSCAFAIPLHEKLFSNFHVNLISSFDKHAARTAISLQVDITSH